MFWKIFFLLLSTTFLYADKQEVQKLTLQLQWKHQFEFAGFYMAKEKGFYKDVGLDVEFLEFNESTNIVESVLSEKADYGLGYSSIIADYLNEKPIVFIANIFKQSPLVLVTQKHIKSLTQLKGAKVEGLANNIDNITLYTMLDKFDIHEADIQTVKPSFSIDNFVNQKVDAMSAFTTNELFLLDEARVQYNIFDPVTYGAKYYDVNLFTSTNEVTKHPQRVRNFKMASLEGWKYALSHQDETIDVILKKYNTQYKSKEALMFEAKQIQHIILPEVHELGSIDLTRVEMIGDSFIQSGFIQNKKMSSFTTLYHFKSNILKHL
ncbi:MAG: ABC transporter substrate-binding protein, partial [Helicobacteraceae bacterium]|nr:ABC transporter substrate-binding protein [Candidatus Sulfurimonas ponti]